MEGCCFGAPMVDRDGLSIGAISVSSPKMRMQDEQLQTRVVAALQRAVAGVSRILAPPTRV